jgi:hypothetical protein
MVAAGAAMRAQDGVAGVGRRPDPSRILVVSRGTDGSNPVSSSAESDANLTSSIRYEEENRHRPPTLLACLYVSCSADALRSTAPDHRENCANRKHANHSQGDQDSAEEQKEREHGENADSQK